MRIRLGVSPDIDTDTMGEAIDAALEATAISQVPLIERGEVPDIRKAIKAGKVKWKPEPPGDEHFDDAKTVLARGWGDCDDLAPWLAASLRASGEYPDAKPFVYQSGPKRWHAVVDRGDGQVLDPSRWAGMGGKKKRVDGIGAAAWSPMVNEKLAIATYPYVHGYAGRVDLPDADMPLSWSAISRGRTQARAVVGALRAAQRVADCVGSPYEEDIARLQGLDALLTEGDAESIGGLLGEIEDYLGEEGLEGIYPAAQAFGSPYLAGSPEVGSFFGKIAKGIKSGVKFATKVVPIKTALNFIPGVGPVASMAYGAASDAMRGSGGGSRPQAQAPQGSRFVPPPPTGITSPTADMLRAETRRSGTTLSMPGGVVIVRF
jgi:hypothetical protein